MHKNQLFRVIVVFLVALLVSVSLGSIAGAYAQSSSERNIEAEPGVLILSVLPGSPADRAGLMRGDIVLAVDDTEINTAQGLADIVLSMLPGDAIRVLVLHGGDEIEMDVILGERNGKTYMGVVPYSDEMPVSVPAAPGDGDPEAMEETEAVPESEVLEEEMIGEPESEARVGAAIIEVVVDSPAAASGLAEGDVITAVNGDALVGEEELIDRIAQYVPGDQVELTVERDGQEMAVTVELGAGALSPDRAFLGVRFMPVVIESAEQSVEAEAEESGDQNAEDLAGSEADVSGEDDDSDEADTADEDIDGHEDCEAWPDDHPRHRAMPHHNHPQGRMPYHHRFHGNDECYPDGSHHFRGPHGFHMPDAGNLEDLDAVGLLHYLLGQMGVDPPDDMTLEELLRLLMDMIGAE